MRISKRGPRRYKRRNPSTGMTLALAALGVAVVGGGGYFAYTKLRGPLCGWCKLPLKDELGGTNVLPSGAGCKAPCLTTPAYHRKNADGRICWLERFGPGSPTSGGVLAAKSA